MPGFRKALLTGAACALIPLVYVSWVGGMYYEQYAASASDLELTQTQLEEYAWVQTYYMDGNGRSELNDAAERDEARVIQNGYVVFNAPIGAETVPEPTHLRWKGKKRCLEPGNENSQCWETNPEIINQ